jgi:Flp pilus assembly protein TadD
VERKSAPKKRGCRRPAAALVTALALAACASGGASDPNAVAYREMLEAHRERAEATPSPETRRAPTVTEKLREGDSYRASGETGRAMWTYLQAHNLDRDDPAPLEKIASLHLKKDPDRAEALFLEIAEKHPESAPAHAGLGLAKLSKGDLPQAGASLRRAVELDPNSVVALSALGVVYDRLEMHDRAQKYYRQALAVQPRDYESLNNLGVSCMLTGDHAAAADAFRRAAALEPRDLAVQNNLGMALAGMEQYDEALEAFRKGGDEQGALNNLAYSYFLNGEFAEAIAHYERALVADGDGKVTILRNLRLAQEAFALEGGSEPAFDPYEVLGIPASASAEAIQSAYKARMKEYHPDKVAHLGEELQELAHRKALEIQQAYRQLRK